MKYQRATKSGQKEQPKTSSSVLQQTSLNRLQAHPLLALQRTIGNQAVLTLLRGKMQADTTTPTLVEPGFSHDFSQIASPSMPTVVPQTKLKVNQPGDVYEQEADRVAEQVMHMRQPDQSNQPDAVSHNTEADQDSVSNNSSGGNALDPETRQFFEPRFGHSFVNVRIHADHSANESARSLGARAYTIGEHITFASGEHQPSTREGRQLLAHELAHVVQQSHVPQHIQPHTLAASLSRVSSCQAQRKLIATGEAAGFAAIANSIIAVQYKVQVSASGEVSIQGTNIQGPPTRDAQELLNTLRTVINDSKTTTIKFIRGSRPSSASERSVIVGSYELSTIDLDDVEAFGFTSSHSREGDNAAVQLVHELTEQYRKQVHSEAFETAHRAGYAAQERLLGATLVSETPMTPIGGDLGEVTTTYRYPDGREVDVITRMNFRTGNIVNVRRVIRPKTEVHRK